MKLLGENQGRIHICLCEDNEKHLSGMADTVKRVAAEKGWNFSLTLFLSADEMLEALKSRTEGDNLRPDVVFADIEMPGTNGIELGKRITRMLPECYFIFTTAFEEYAIQGYEARAYRFLLKPVTAERVSQTMEQIMLEKERNKCLLLKDQGLEVIVPLKDIIYISAEDKYTIVHTKEVSYYDKISLKECENLLNQYGFYQIHRKYIINMKHHKKVGKGVVVVSGGTELKISRDREEAYRKYFMAQLEKGMLE